MKPTSILFAVAMTVVTPMAVAGINEDVLQLQHQWAKVNYQLQGKEQKQAFQALETQADKVVASYPDSAEGWIWRGIIKSSYAGAKGGLGALSLVKSAKGDLEKALTLNDKALGGSAYTSLGTLYFKVPGWPIGFGDDDKAKTLLKQALALNPDGIDSNFFYAEYLEQEGEYKEAEQYLQKAQRAPARPERPLADQGRQHEIVLEMAKIKDKLKTTTNASFIDRR